MRRRVLLKLAPILREARSWVIPAVMVFAAKSSFGAVNYVPTGSMEPTILVGDALLINHLAYSLRVPFTTLSLVRWGAPQRGDIVVCFEPGDGTRLVKRVVGLPGDTIELREDTLYVNGVAARYRAAGPALVRTVSRTERPQAVCGTETWGGRSHSLMVLPRVPARRTFGPLVVPAGSYFVMGDNRDNSKDSRCFGAVPKHEIVGKAEGIVISLDPEHAYLPRWVRCFSELN